MTEPKPTKYRPGSRNPKYRLDARISPNRLVALNVLFGSFAIQYIPAGEKPEEDEDIEPDVVVGNPETETASVRINMPGTSKWRYLSLNLSSLTYTELIMLKEFFETAFALAEPVVKERDSIADEAYNSGDDTYSRIYRPIPEFVVRERTFVSDDQSLRGRLEDAAARMRALRDRALRARDYGGVVAEPDPKDDVPQDDGPAPDEPPTVR